MQLPVKRIWSALSPILLMEGLIWVTFSFFGGCILTDIDGPCRIRFDEPLLWPSMILFSVFTIPWVVLILFVQPRIRWGMALLVPFQVAYFFSRNEHGLDDTVAWMTYLIPIAVSVILTVIHRKLRSKARTKTSS